MSTLANWITPVLWALGCLTFLVVCWFFYLAVMNLKVHVKELGPVAKVFGYYGLLLGLVLDLILTLVFTLVFWSPPKELTLTGRLKRHRAEGGWRGTIAAYICDKLLNQFDPSGKHC